MNSNKLAIQGAPPAFPDGPPRWPVADTRIFESVTQAVQSGDWGRYDSELGDTLMELLKRVFQVEHTLLCSSGTIAVELALRGVGVKKGHEVLLAGYDFPGNFRAIEAIGAMPVLLDVAPGSWTLQIEQLESAISENTQAVLASHLHGHVVNMQQLRSVTEKHDLAIVEDACQVPGSIQDGKPLGSLGDVGVLSFGGSKLLSAGRGGAILTNAPDILQRAKIFGSRGNEAFPLSQLQAAALIPQIERLDEVAEQRDRGCRLLLEKLVASDASPLVSNLPGENSTQDDSQNHFGYVQRVAPYKFPIRVAEENRNLVIQAIEAEGIAVGEGFRGFTSRSTRRCRKPVDLTHSQRAARETILLHHPILLESVEYLEQVAEILIQVFRYQNS